VKVLRQYRADVDVSALCRLFGKTRQGFYKQLKSKENQHLEDELVLQLVRELREKMPCLGTRKLLHLLKEPLAKHGIEMGRDRLFALLESQQMLVRQRRRSSRTTYSFHRFRKYDNLIRDFVPKAPHQLWVSDITYIAVGEGFSYLSLVTDAYSHKIVGYHLHTGLQAVGAVKAVQMAIAQRTKTRRRLIHHSDRGFQYCCELYVEVLENEKIMISMTQNGDPYENAMAERVNGILKVEFDLYRRFETHEQAQQAVDQAVKTYNEVRPHASCDFLTPAQAHEKEGVLKKRWKNYPAKRETAVNLVPDEMMN